MENKNALIFSIVGALFLVVIVIGVSFAMYTFTGTGTRENVIETGSVTVNCVDQTVINLTNQYPMTDAVGSQLTGDAEMTCNVTATINGSITLNYEVGFTSVTEGATLTDDYVKFNITKDGSYLLGTTSTTGITMASRAGSTGTMTNTDGSKMFSSYFLDSGVFNASGNHVYKVRAWVADTYDLPTTTTDTDGTHTSNTTAETFSFKFKVIAEQG